MKKLKIATSKSLRKASNEAIARCLFTTNDAERQDLIKQAKNLLNTAYIMDIEAIEKFEKGIIG